MRRRPREIDPDEITFRSRSAASSSPTSARRIQRRRDGGIRAQGNGTCRQAVEDKVIEEFLVSSGSLIRRLTGADLRSVEQAQTEVKLFAQPHDRQIGEGLVKRTQCPF